MIKKWTKSFSLLAIMIVFAVVVNPTVSHATESPVTKIDGQPIKNGIECWGKSGDAVITPFWGRFYYRTTVTLAESSKKTKIKLKYSHHVTPSKPGAFKLTVGKKTVRICKLVSHPSEPSHAKANIFLESVQIKTGNKWKKVAITNDGVKLDGVYSEMKDLTLKKIPKGTKLRIMFNVRIWVPRKSYN